MLKTNLKICGYVTALPRAGSMAGGTLFYHELCKAFVEAGFKVDVQMSPRLREHKTITIDGVTYSPYVNPDEYDIIFLHSAALDSNPSLIRFKQPVIYLLHSESPLIQRSLNELTHKDILICNSDALQEKVKDLPCQHFVLYPLCNKIYRESTDSTRKYITLIGSSIVKNVNLFYDLAKSYPRESFMHVKGGYGNARAHGGLNLKITKNTDNLKAIYDKTKILLVPSTSETYSLCAREAGLQGIPVIASDLPGIRENLGSAGLYADPNDIRTFCKQLNYLKDASNYKKASQEIKMHCIREEYKNDERVNSLIRLLRHPRR